MSSVIEKIETRYGVFEIWSPTTIFYVQQVIDFNSLLNVRINRGSHYHLICFLGANNEFFFEYNKRLKFTTKAKAKKALNKYLDECELDYIDPDWLENWIPKVNEKVKIIGPNKRRNKCKFSHESKGNELNWKGAYNELIGTFSKVGAYNVMDDAVHIKNPFIGNDFLYFERCWLVPCNAVKKQKAKPRPNRVVRIRKNV